MIIQVEDFQKVTENQSYQEKSDGRYSLFWDWAADENYLYFCNYDVNGIVEVFDRKEKKCSALCNKPECPHKYTGNYFVEDCNAYAGTFSTMRYYDGDLYMIDTEYEKTEDTKMNEIICLYRMKTDGSGKDKVCELATIYPDEIVMAEGDDGINYDIYWNIYRGYLYYSYRIGTTGLKDDTFHNNQSNYVMRIHLAHPSDKTYIMPLEGTSVEQISFQGSGSYVYFYDIDYEQNDTGYLYRYNIEANQVERMPFGQTRTEHYTPVEDIVYYTKYNEMDANLYRYESSIDTTTKLCDLKDYDNRFGSVYDSVCLMHDENYIYAYSTVEAETGLSSCIVLDFNGQYITEFDMMIDGMVTTGMRIDREYILLKVSDQCYYLRKEELFLGIFAPNLIDIRKE